MINTSSDFITMIAAYDAGRLMEMIAATILAVVSIWFWRHLKIERWAFASGLLVMPFIYVAFALYADTTAIAYLEILSATPFVIAALFCFRLGWHSSIYLLAAGWFAHGLYDLGHNLFFVNSGTPMWYPVICGVFDFVVASYLILIARNVSKSPDIRSQHP